MKTQRRPRHIRMKGLDSTNRFPLSFSADELRILKLGLAALQEKAALSVHSSEACPAADASFGQAAANLLSKLSDAEASLQSVPWPPCAIGEEDYPAEELSQIQKVMSVFADYLSKTESLQLFWCSDGLVSFTINPACKPYDPERYFGRLVDTAEEVCTEILRDFAQTVLEREGLLGEKYTYYYEATDPVSKAAVADAARPYLEQLPEYPDTLESIYRGLY